MTGSKKVLISLLIAFTALAGGAALLLFAITTDQSASIVIGHEYFTQAAMNESDANEDTMSSPVYAYATASKLFVADWLNSRVLIYNSIPTSDGDFADVVLGQPDMQSSSTGVSATTFSLPRGVFYDGTRLFIADQSNNRVLIYNSLPTVNGTAADVVVGQVDMNSSAFACTATGMQQPYGVFSDGTRLFVASQSQNRVLIYDPIPTADNAAATTIIGQPNDSTCSLAVTAAKLRSPSGVFRDASNLYVSDQLNNRALIYDWSTIATGASAYRVLGQADFISGSVNRGGTRTANTLSGPKSIYVEGTKVLIADSGNHRVLIFDTIPVVDGQNADWVVGQTNMTSSTPNNGGIGPNTLNSPSSATSNGTKLFVADTNNNRVLIYNTIPAANNASANIVAGQTDFVSSMANQSSTTVPSAYSLRTPYNINTDGTKMYIADQGNNRILIFNSLPTKNHPAADVVVGQALMTTRGTGITATTMNSPYAVFATNSQMFVADGSNNRVLIYNTIPAANGATVDVVVGQPDPTSNSANNPLMGGLGASTMWKPYGVYATATTLVVADGSNNRVLIYTSMPVADGASADFVVGQPDMTSNTVNNPVLGGLGANTLNQPWDVMIVSGKLFIADTNNNRVLIFNSIPGADGASADVVVGQPNMTSNTANQGGGAVAAANTLSAPKGVYSDGEKLVISDQGNNRVLIFNSIPVANDASADLVIGQADMASTAVNQGGGTTPGPNTVKTPMRAFYVNGKLYVGDNGNNRALIYQPYVEHGTVIKMW